MGLFINIVRYLLKGVISLGFRFRKSVNLGGGFRINLSKSGVGYSWGVKGYRITKTAHGKTRKTYSIPGTGISYSEQIGNGYSKSTTPNTFNHSYDTMADIISEDVSNMQPFEYSELLNALKKAITINRLSNILIFAFIFGASFRQAFIISFIGIIFKIYISTIGRVNILYNFDGYSEAKYKENYNRWLSLNESDKLWQIIQSGHISNQKVNAGASQQVKRIPFKINKKSPNYLYVDQTILSIKLKNERLFLLPDKILVYKSSNFGVVDYDSINIDVSFINFIEDQRVPKDAEIIRYSWKFVNKNGGPDKRYKNNKQLPVCRYGEITITSPNGLNIVLYCSNANKVYLLKSKNN